MEIICENSWSQEFKHCFGPFHKLSVFQLYCIFFIFCFAMYIVNANQLFSFSCPVGVAIFMDGGGVTMMQ